MSNELNPSLPPEPVQLRDEALRLLKDQNVKWSMLVLMASLRSYALANMVLARTLEEEAASPGIYEYILESAKSRAQEPMHLGELLSMHQEFVPAFIQEEISRDAEGQATAEKAAAAQARRGGKLVCQVTVGEHRIELLPGSLLVLLGDARQVAEALDKLLDQEQDYCYQGAEPEPVSREEILYLDHRLRKGSLCRRVPMSRWGCAATEKKTWDKLWQALGGNHNHLVISNLNLAGKFPPPDGKTVASQVKNSISTLSRWLAGRNTRAIAGAYYPQKNEPDYKEQLATYAAGRTNVILHTLGTLS